MNNRLPIALLGGAAALAGVTYWSYRRNFPAAKPLNGQNYKVKTEQLPVRYDGRTVYGELLSPEGLQGKKPTVICCHGFGANYQAMKLRIGSSLAMSGWNAYCFDFCGGSPRSKSSGRFHDMTVFTEKEDLLHVIDVVRTLPEVDTSRLYLLGESQGGFVAAITAPERAEELRALVLHYPAFCIPEDTRKRFASKEAIPDETRILHQKLGGEYSRAVYDYDVYEALAGYTGPVLILHGDADSLVPMEYGKKAAEVYENAEFITLPGEPHGWTGKGKREAAELSFRFLEKIDTGE